MPVRKSSDQIKTCYFRVVMIVNETSFAEVGGIFISKSIPVYLKEDKYLSTYYCFSFQITKFIGYSWAPKLCRHRRQTNQQL